MLATAIGCETTHVCGYCDCDPGCDRCSYYFGYMGGSVYGPGAMGSVTTAAPAAGGAPAPAPAPKPSPDK